MTTSFPPINYPNKPVPPFSAPAPRNPFPGFYPDLWKNITGKPYITVSSKGLANGQSEYFNDGADFGPDSVQADGSLTKTTGIQEAINYGILLSPDSYHNPGVTIQLLRGDFYLNTDLYVYVPAGNVNGVSLRGAGRNVTFIIINAENMKGVIPYTETETFSGEGITFQDLNIYLGPSLSPNTVYSLVDLDSFQSAKLNFINCKFNTIGNADFSSTNVLLHGGIYQNSKNMYNRLNFIGCSFTGVNVYNDYSNNLTNFTNCDFNQGITASGTLISREGSSVATLNFLGSNINGHISLSGVGSTSTVMTNFNGSFVNGEISVSSGSHFVSFFSSVWNIISGDTAVFAQSGGNLYIYGEQWIVIDSIKLIDQTGGSLLKAHIGTGYPYASNPTMNISPQVSIPTNPPVSGTVYQNTNGYDIEIDLPVYATTAGTAGYVTIATGSTDTPSSIGNQYVSGDTSSTATQIIRVRVPAGWYYSFTGSGVTFATATPFAE